MNDLPSLPHVKNQQLKDQLSKLNEEIKKDPAKASKLLDYCIKYFDPYWLERLVQKMEE